MKRLSKSNKMTNEQRIANEKNIINKMVEIVATYGWKLGHVYDGEDGVPCTTGDAAYEVCDSVDESSVRFAVFTKDGADHGVLIILNNGNDGWDVIADYNYSPKDNFNEAMEAVGNWVSAEAEKVGA